MDDYGQMFLDTSGSNFQGIKAEKYTPHADV
jgi:hypothetical protein